MRARPETMIFHGAVVILLGLLAGFPYALVVTGSLAGSERAWRMAHLEGVLNGLLVIVVAAVWDRLALDGWKRDVLAWSLVLIAYGNVVASVIGATFAGRGLEPGGSPIRTRTRTPHGTGNMLRARRRHDSSTVTATTGVSGAASRSARVPAGRNAPSSPTRARVPSGKITAEARPRRTRPASSRIATRAEGASPRSISTCPPRRRL